ncbi:DUF5813 family protein [Haloplanus halobius]|uniref:DUF5813 family protein n=1 Tax=Haloplanus halobius TaxID=2934938 RepID=UPI00200FCAD2|nr:DUF5813 family protein [Haloplanus sp. XH21]
MSEASGRVARAFRDHDAFERIDDGRFEATTTVFDAVVTATETDGRVEFGVEIRVPALSAAVEGDVAAVVEEGWHETLELRLEDIDGVTRGDQDLDPTVRLAVDEVVVDVAFTDINERRGADDAAAIINYVEGTYVQGLIPGYDYTGPAAQLVDRARQASE